MAFVKLSTGISLYTEQSGPDKAAPWLVLVRGLGSRGERWAPVVSKYSRTFRCLTFDNRGSGRSDAPPGPYTTAEMADDVVSLCDTLGIESFHLSGMSLGGAIAQEVSLKIPDRVSSLQVHGSWARAEGVSRLYFLFRTALVEAGLHDPVSTGALLHLYSAEYVNDLGDQLESLVSEMAAQPASVVGLRGQLAAALKHDTLERLPAISCPTLITVGELDACISPRPSVRMAATIPHATLHKFPRCGHLVDVERLDEFADVTMSWLRAL